MLQYLISNSTNISFYRTNHRSPVSKVFQWATDSFEFYCTCFMKNSDFLKLIFENVLRNFNSRNLIHDNVFLYNKLQTLYKIAILKYFHKYCLYYISTYINWLARHIYIMNIRICFRKMFEISSTRLLFIHFSIIYGRFQIQKKYLRKLIYSIQKSHNKNAKFYIEFSVQNYHIQVLYIYRIVLYLNNARIYIFLSLLKTEFFKFFGQFLKGFSDTFFQFVLSNSPEFYKFIKVNRFRYHLLKKLLLRNKTY